MSSFSTALILKYNNTQSSNKKPPNTPTLIIVQLLNRKQMRRSKFRRPCKVLIFNGARVLVAIVRSLHSAAELTHENKSAIHNCCTGKAVRSGAYYYRQLHPDILLEMDDLDKLTLKEYDDLCGIKRKYISTRKMAHIRQRAKERQRVKIAISHQEMN